MTSTNNVFKPSGEITWDSKEPVGKITWDKELEKVEEPAIEQEPVQEPIPEEVSEYAGLDDGWYRDPDTGEKFEIKKGKRLIGSSSRYERIAGSEDAMLMKELLNKLNKSGADK